MPLWASDALALPAAESKVSEGLSWSTHLGMVEQRLHLTLNLMEFVLWECSIGCKPPHFFLGRILHG